MAVLGSGLRTCTQTEPRIGELNSQCRRTFDVRISPDVGPRPYQFPERNRIISGLSELTVLVEAGVKSGSLITARLALEQGRDLCAVPGPALSPLSAGCHRMIRQGAALVTSVEEVAEEIGLPETVPTTDGTAIEVSSAPVPLDQTSAQILKDGYCG